MAPLLLNVSGQELENVMAPPHPNSSAHPTERLVGQAPAIVALRAHLRQLVAFDALDNPAVRTLLLQGETGTGKGLVARVIHESGPRVRGPFVEVNCAAIPESLLEAELFGFEPGAFTDAKRAKPGLWEAASGGILFLDEIDILPLTLQSKLLTVIEAKRVRRLGAVADHPTDVKLIAATQADLRARVAEGQFRADLYHRVAVVLLEIPPLRTRGDDVVLLAQHYLQRAAEAYRLHPKCLDPQAEMWLQRYPWPGNVRELGHLMERVTLLCPDPLIGPEALEQLCVLLSKSATPVSTSPLEAETEAAVEATQIQQALHQTAGNVARAARLLGMSRGALRHRMARYRIAPPSQGGKTGVALPQQRVGWSMGPTVPQDHGQAGLLSGAAATPTQNWEQKPVAVLAVEVTWPANHEAWASQYEPWTVTSRWEQTIVEKLQGFGGVVLPHTPALLIAAFGVPRTLEQAPERAVRAALALRGFVMDVHDTGYRPELRLALHYGEVLVDTEAVDPTVRLLPIGDTLARPGWLVGHAEPGEILASPEMDRVVGGCCELHACKELPRREHTQLPGAYTLVGLRSQGTTLQVHTQRPLSRFVGREQELGVLEDLLTRAREGRGQIVGVIGEPGVGKSRLCYEFVRTHQTHGWRILETRADSYTQGMPYWPIVAMLKRYFQLDVDDDQQTIRGKIAQKVLALEATLEPILPALFMLLEVPIEDALWQNLDPSQRRQRFMEAVKLLLLCESGIRPLILVAENLHWIDGETQVFLDSLVESLPAAHVLLLVSYRPEYQHGWTSKTYYTQLRLDPLPPASVEALLQHLMGDDAGLEPLKQCLIERTQGNPFFLEETVRTLVETQTLVGGPGAYHLGSARPGIQVPATVQAVLAARIDHLPDADKRLLQTAAVIGTEVPFSLLQAVAELPEAPLHAVLAHLQTAEFLYETGLFPVREYTFKHALSHEVAYRSLLPERRRGLHVHLVEVIETFPPERVAEQVERLAHHALLGEVWDKAVTYCQQAAARARERAAPREAATFLEQALQALVHLPENGDTQTLAIELRLALAPRLSQLGERGRLRTLLGEAEALARALDDPLWLGRVLARMANVLRTTRDFEGAIAAGQQALEFAAALGDSALQVQASHRLGQLYYGIGDYRRAAELLRRNVEAEERESGTPSTVWGIQSRMWLAKTLSTFGAFAEGRRHGEEALCLATRAGRGLLPMLAYKHLGSLYLAQGDLESAVRVLDQGLALCRASGDLSDLLVIAAALGYAYALQGRLAEGHALLEEGVGVSENIHMGARQNPLLVAWLSEVCRLAGHGEEAWQHACQALDLARQQKARGEEACALHQLGAVHAHADPPDVAQAEAHYRQALTLAEELGMRPLQAHCHRGLGTLYTKISRREQARAELSTAIALYRAMDMTFWLPQAEAALERAL
jgi:DNA-binding NtrC family response regulator/tetratricopeptide (TPR) repeat protein